MNDEGFRNRYRHSDDSSAHCDQVYRVVYNESENGAYTDDVCRANSRLNVAESRYDAFRRVNKGEPQRRATTREAEHTDSNGERSSDLKVADVV